MLSEDTFADILRTAQLRRQSAYTHSSAPDSAGIASAFRSLGLLLSRLKSCLSIVSSFTLGSYFLASHLVQVSSLLCVEEGGDRVLNSFSNRERLASES